MKKLVLSIALLGACPVAIADLSESCKTYFDKLDSLVKVIPEDTVTKQQTDVIKQSLEMGKQQISSLSAENQDSACEQAIDLLKQIEASLPKR
ncbi:MULTISPECIES: DUF5339 domain-containing protein [unclassified Gilliamella]|uniref:DUF5339 domain-containing protein n=1 Tax=unclassified Gilliamella TaxID=2685620 RepID=UPI0009C04427|nr:DUF5339 domain-containing protein [Gilliamella apicola]